VSHSMVFITIVRNTHLERCLPGQESDHDNHLEITDALDLVDLVVFWRS